MFKGFQFGLGVTAAFLAVGTAMTMYHNHEIDRRQSEAIDRGIEISIEQEKEALRQEYYAYLEACSEYQDEDQCEYTRVLAQRLIDRGIQF